MFISADIKVNLFGFECGNLLANFVGSRPRSVSVKFSPFSVRGNFGHSFIN